MAVSTETLTLGERGLSLDLGSGAATYFNYYWLRDNAPASFDPETRERVFDIFTLDDAPRPETARLSADALEIRWADGSDCRYPVAFLEAYAGGGPRDDPAALPRRAWYSDFYDRMQRFPQPRLLSDPELLKAWIEALLVDGVAIVTDMPDSDAGLTELAETVGPVRPTFFGSYFDVRTMIAPTNLAYTASALELHTDTPAEELAPGVQLLHCRRNSVAGGESLFADGVAVAEDLRREDPEAFRLLAETEIPFYCEHDSYDMRSRQRVIETDALGNVTGVTISQHMADIFDLPQAFLDDYYPAFCAFGRMLQRPRYVMHFRLNAGECIVFDNHRIVHGRAGYTAESGERYLRGCYVDREEMKSRYRTLTSAGGRFRAA